MINLLEDYEPAFEDAEMLVKYLGGGFNYELTQLDRAIFTVADLFQRLGTSWERENKSVWQLLQLVTRPAPLAKEGVKARVLDLFLKSKGLKDELKGIKLALIGEVKGKDVDQAVLSAKVAADYFGRLSPKRKEDVKYIKALLPIAISVGGEGAILAEKLRDVVAVINESLSVEAASSQPLVAIEPPKETVNIDKLITLAEELFKVYGRSLCKKISVNGQMVLFEEAKKFIPIAVRKLVVTEPHTLRPYEKSAILLTLKHIRELMFQIRTEYAANPNDLVGRLIQSKRLHPEKLLDRIRELLAEIIRHYWGLSDSETETILPEVQQVALSCTTALVLTALDRLLKPGNILLFLERILTEKINFKDLEDALPLPQTGGVKDDLFAYKVGEEIEHILRALAETAKGKSAVVNMAFKFFDRKEVGQKTAAQMNAVVNSQISSKPLIFLHHILLYQEGDHKKPLLLEKKSLEDFDLSEVLKKAINSLFSEKTFLVKWLSRMNFTQNALDNLVNLAVQFVKSKEGLELLAVYLLEMHLDFLRRPSV